MDHTWFAKKSENLTKLFIYCGVLETYREPSSNRIKRMSAITWWSPQCCWSINLYPNLQQCLCWWNLPDAKVWKPRQFQLLSINPRILRRSFIKGQRENKRLCCAIPHQKPLWTMKWWSSWKPSSRLIRKVDENWRMMQERFQQIAIS